MSRWLLVVGALVVLGCSGGGTKSTPTPSGEKGPEKAPAAALPVCTALTAIECGTRADCSCTFIGHCDCDCTPAERVGWTCDKPLGCGTCNASCFNAAGCTPASSP